MAESRKIGESLDLVRVTRPGGFLVHLSGIIDGTFDRPAFVEWVHGLLVFDLYGVRRVTLYGVREWLSALKDIESPGYYFIRVRPAVLSQFNAVPNFAGRGQLVSFYAPYQCTICKKKIRALVDLTQHYSAVRALEPPPALCVHCGGKAALDDDPEALFAYAASAPAPNVPPVVRSIIASAWGGAELRFSIKKVVRGRVTALWISGPLDHTAQFGRLAEKLTETTIIVLRGIWSVTDKGLARLEAFLRPVETPVYLARLPLCLVLALGQRPHVCGRARVVSARLPARCATCHDEVEVDLDASLLRGMANDALRRPACPECGDLLTGFAPETLRAATALPLGDAPDLVKQHLGDRTRPLVRPVKIESEDESHGAFTPTLQTGEPAPPPPSSVVTPKQIGRYEAGRRIGIGPVATWYVGRDMANRDAPPVMLKVIHPHIAREPAFVEALRRETMAAAWIRHPNIVRILDFVQDARGVAVVMEYVDSARLAEIVRMLHDDHRLIQMDVALEVALDILEGLATIHGASAPNEPSVALVHGGVMPSSILLGTDGLTRIADLETARVKATVNDATSQLTQRLGYMAPEQLRGEPIDPRCDLYAVGVLLWELVAGPRHGTDRKVRAIPRPLAEVCLRGLQADPGARFPSAGAFSAALREAASLSDMAPASPYHVAAVVRRFKAIGI